MPKVSAITHRYLGQPMFKIIDEARRMEMKGVDVVHLEIGDPDFNTPEFIREAAIQSIRANQTHYVSSWGTPELRLAVQEATKASRGFEPGLEQILITPGANIAIFYAIATTTGPGEEVLFPDPGFPSYVSTIASTGVKGTPYPLFSKNRFELRAEDIEPLISEKTKLLIVNNPQNPTGAVTSEHHLREIYELAAEHDLWIYSDEIYARMNYGETQHFSLASIDHSKDRVILSNGFSKSFAMTGWRLGAVIAPPKLTERMMLLLQTTSSCVPPFIQSAGIAALNGDQAEINGMMLSYRARRQMLVDGLNGIEGIRCHDPGGAFYAFPDISSFGLSSDEFASRLLSESGVAVVSGTNFGSQGEGFIRLAYATSESRILEGIRRIEEFCQRIV